MATAAPPGRRGPLRLLVALALLLGGGGARGGPAGEVAALGRPTIRVFTGRDGLPQNAVEAVAMDLEGYLWVGTQGGAAFYNGRAWTAVRLPNPEESSWVRCLIRARDGSLWFGRDQGGICRYQGGGWRQYGAGEGLQNTKVHALLEREDGTLLAGTSRGLLRLEGRQWIPVKDALGGELPPVLCLLEGRGLGRPLWVGTEQGLARSDGGAWAWSGPRQGLPSAIVWSLHEGSDGSLWAGTGRGIGRLQQGRWRAYGPAEGVPANAVNRILEAEEEGQRVLYAATDEGLGRFSGGRWRFLNTKNGLPNQVVRSLLAEPAAGGPSTVWAGTIGGLVRLQRRAWFAVDMRSGLPDDVVFSLGETPSPAAFWVGTLGGGLARFQGGAWRTYGPDSAVPDRHILALRGTLREPGGPALWVGTRGGGVLRMRGEAWTRSGEAQGLPDGWVYALHESGDPAQPWGLWAGTRKGPALWDGRRWSVPRIPAPPAPVMGFLETLGPAGRGQLWVATRGEGLLLREAGAWRRYGAGDGLTDDRIMSLLEVKDAEGVRWLWAGASRGIARRRLDREDALWEALAGEKLPGLPGQLVYQLRADAAGRVYAFTDHGVARLTPRVPSPEDPALFSAFTFTVGDGLPSNGCTQGSTLVDAEGRLWTGTVGGAAFLVPALGDPPREAGPLRLEHLRIAGRDMPLVEGREIPWQEQGLVFEYALLRYAREEDIRYSTQLEGLDAAPSEWVPDGKREYPTLPAGRYTFRVWARDHAGNLARPVSYPFTVLPRPWATWWARLGYAMGGLLLLAGVVRYRTALLRARTRELEEGVEERTHALSAAVRQLQEARDEAMGATRAKSEILATVSHEIRTPLTAVLGMAELLAETPMTPEQADYSRTLRSSAENLLKMLNDVLDLSKIEARRLDLELVPFDLLEEVEDCLALMAEPAQRKGLELASLVHPEVPVRVMGDPSRLRQVLVNLLGNAIKFTPGGEIAIVVRELGPTGAGSWLRFEVRDQGPGIDPEVLPTLFGAFTQGDASTQRRFGGTGLGLDICRRLVDLMQGRIGVESVPGQGSTFWFELPFGLQADPWPGLPPFAGDRAVVVASPGAACREGVVQQLSAWGLHPRPAADLEGLARLLQAEPQAALAIVDAALLPDGVPPGPWAVPERTPLLLLCTLRQLRGEAPPRPAARAAQLPKPVRRARLHRAVSRALGLAPPEAPARPAPEPRPARILVVDDNDATRQVTLLHLRGLGHGAAAASGAAEGLDLLARERFRLVLMDCEMPGMDGLEATRRIRAGEAPGARLPVLALTAHASEEVRRRCLAAGMDEVLTKPLRRDALVEALARWAGEAPAGTEDRRARADRPAASASPLDEATWAGLRHLEILTGPGAIADLVGTFLADAPVRLQRLEQALAAGDLESASRDAHDLKANASTLGILHLAGVMAAIESSTRGQGALDMGPALARARVLLDEARAALEGVLD